MTSNQFLTAKLTRHGQVTLPKEVRAKLGASEGDLIAFMEERGRFWIAVVSLTLRPGAVPAAKTK